MAGLPTLKVGDRVFLNPCTQWEPEAIASPLLGKVGQITERWGISGRSRYKVRFPCGAILGPLTALELKSY